MSLLLHAIRHKLRVSEHCAKQVSLASKVCMQMLREPNQPKSHLAARVMSNLNSFLLQQISCTPAFTRTFGTVLMYSLHILFREIKFKISEKHNHGIFKFD